MYQCRVNRNKESLTDLGYRTLGGLPKRWRQWWLNRYTAPTWTRALNNSATSTWTIRNLHQRCWEKDWLTLTMKKVHCLLNCWVLPLERKKLAEKATFDMRISSPPGEKGEETVGSPAGSNGGLARNIGANLAWRSWREGDEGVWTTDSPSNKEPLLLIWCQWYWGEILLVSRLRIREKLEVWSLMKKNLIVNQRSHSSYGNICTYLLKVASDIVLPTHWLFCAASNIGPHLWIGISST